MTAERFTNPFAKRSRPHKWRSHLIRQLAFIFLTASTSDEERGSQTEGSRANDREAARMILILH